MEIYIPPSRAHRASSISLGLAPELPDDLGVLEDAVKEIEDAISHLRRSNKEMQEFDPEGEDPDLRDAIAENVEALKKKEERLNHIREKMATIGARKDACVHNAPTATAAGAAAGAAAGGVAAAAERPKASSSASPSDKEGLPEEPAGSAAAPATATAATTAAAPTSAAATARATRDFANSETEGIAHLTDRLRQLSTSTADKGALSSSKEKDEGIYL